MPFAALGLQPELVRAVADEGYKLPTPIQREAIPLALAGRDLIGSAQTGTGKTAAFRASDPPAPVRQWPAPSCSGRWCWSPLVSWPSRWWSARRPTEAIFRSLAAAIYGGVGMEPQTKALARGVDIVVATPGRLLDHMDAGISTSRDSKSSSWTRPTGCSTWGSRPTSGGSSMRCRRTADHAFLGHYLGRCRAPGALGRCRGMPRSRSAAGQRRPTASSMELIAVDKLPKRARSPRSCCASPTVRRWCSPAPSTVPTSWSPSCAARASCATRSMAIRPRAIAQRTLDCSASGNRTSWSRRISPRGASTWTTSGMVVNFDVPKDPEVYVHRVGRTARAGHSGLALTLMSPDEWLLMADIEKLVGQTFPRDQSRDSSPWQSRRPPGRPSSRRPSRRGRWGIGRAAGAAARATSGSSGIP